MGLGIHSEQGPSFSHLVRLDYLSQRLIPAFLCYNRSQSQTINEGDDLQEASMPEIKEEGDS